MIVDVTPDPEVLRIAVDYGRVLVSRDVTTMPGHFVRFVAQRELPGLLLIPSRRPIGAVIEGLWTVWSTWTPKDLCNQALGSLKTGQKLPHPPNGPIVP